MKCSNTTANFSMLNSACAVPSFACTDTCLRRLRNLVAIIPLQVRNLVAIIPLQVRIHLRGPTRAPETGDHGDSLCRATTTPRAGRSRRPGDQTALGIVYGRRAPRAQRGTPHCRGADHSNNCNPWGQGPNTISLPQRRSEPFDPGWSHSP